ncbi:MAG: hypothetical protein M3O98_05800 [Actinomycetota bacterium]|nr:hypothetical protein [Actinomycetota bacterium]
MVDLDGRVSPEEGVLGGTQPVPFRVPVALAGRVFPFVVAEKWMHRLWKLNLSMFLVTVPYPVQSATIV